MKFGVGAAVVFLAIGLMFLWLSSSERVPAAPGSAGDPDAGGAAAAVVASKGADAGSSEVEGSIERRRTVDPRPRLRGRLVQGDGVLSGHVVRSFIDSAGRLLPSGYAVYPLATQSRRERAAASSSLVPSRGGIG